MKVEHQGKQEHHCRLIPERVLRGASLGRGVLEQVGCQLLHIIVCLEIDKGIVAMAFFHVDQVDHLDVIALSFQQVSRVSQELALRVKAYKGCVGVHDVWLGIEPGFACAGAAADQRIEVAAVLMPAQADRHILREDLVFGLGLGGIFAVDLTGIAPFSRAVLLPLAVITDRGQVNRNGDSVDEQKNEDSFQAVLTPYNIKGLAHDCAELG